MDIAPIMEKKGEKKRENEMETSMISGVKAWGLSRHSTKESCSMVQTIKEYKILAGYSLDFSRP